MDKQIDADYEALHPHLDAGQREELDGMIASQANWKKAGLIAVGAAVFILVAIQLFG